VVTDTLLDHRVGEGPVTDGQIDLFGVATSPTTKPARLARVLRVLITVKAAPNPSSTYGETVCVAGLSADPSHPGWVRLYPINFRDLEDTSRFSKYDIVTVEARPAEQDSRFESWRPNMATLTVEDHLPPWTRRRNLINPQIEPSMCALWPNADTVGAHSLAAIKVADVSRFEVTQHPGWSKEDQKKIDNYVNQAELFDEKDKTALEAPRFVGKYHWRCSAPRCNNGHTQTLLDWEFIALQRRLAGYSEPEAKAQLRAKFLDELCAPTKDVAFYVGNQAKRRKTFSVLGVYYPPTK
jgi:hypothetical protein